MNIKRMADEYRRKVISTGMRAREEIEEVCEKIDYFGGIDSACRYLRQWYLHLAKALGEEKDLKLLKASWESLKLMKKEFHGEHHGHRILSEKEKERLRARVRIALEQYDRFFQKLPKLIEKSLKKAVRESGIL